MNDDFTLFFHTHPMATDFESGVTTEFKTLRSFCDAFKNYCEKRGDDIDKNKIWFNILYEKASDTEQGIYADYDLCYLNESLKLSEKDLEDFLLEWRQNRDKDKKYYTDEQSKRYSSYRESRFYEIHYYEPSFIERYKQCPHPLIQSMIGGSFLNMGDEVGFGFIMNGLTRAVVFPNIYWNNVRAIHGYIECIWIALYYIQKFEKVDKEENYAFYKKFVSNFYAEQKDRPYSDLFWLRYSLIELLLIYMQRVLSIDPNNHSNPDIYNNRAELFYGCSNIMRIIFSNYGIPTMIPDLHFISDKHLAFSTASKIDQNMGGLFLQCLWDSKMMYEYGNLNYPTEDGGYKGIEEETWDQIVESKKMLTFEISQKIYNKYKTGHVFITKMQIELLLSYLLCHHVEKKDLKLMHNQFDDQH